MYNVFRSYISFDILRRVLADYFGYNIQYVMNITDIDDKIIKRARQNYLYDNYVTRVKEMSLDQMINDQNAILATYKEICMKNNDPDKKPMLLKTLNRLNNSIELVQNKKNEEKADIMEIKEAFLNEARDAIVEWLDKNEGHTVNENHIFEDLPKLWEDKFHEDMNALNVSILLPYSSVSWTLLLQRDDERYTQMLHYPS